MGRSRSRSKGRLRGVALLLGLLTTVAACSSTSGPPSSSAVETTRPGPVIGLARLKQEEVLPVAVGDDVWEVVVCHIPVGTLDPLYDPMPDRLALTSADLVPLLTPVTDYFGRWSLGRYHPTFIAGPDVSVGVDEVLADGEGESSDICVDRAIEASTTGARGVLIVADAQHGEDQWGGRGRPGEPCETESCAAHDTGRMVYVGAADFMPYWEGDPPLDLVEHEMGHAIGWPHSSTSADNYGQGVYDSVIDVMSDSAAPREAAPESRDGPSTLAINLFRSGWLADFDVEETTGSGSFELAAVDAAPGAGTRLLVIDTSETSFVTVELIQSGVDNVHIGGAGVAVHVVDFSDAVCEVPPCVGTARQQIQVRGSQRGDGLASANEMVSVLVDGVNVSFQVGAITVGTSGSSTTVDVNVGA